MQPNKEIKQKTKQTKCTHKLTNFSKVNKQGKHSDEQTSISCTGKQTKKNINAKKWKKYRKQMHKSKENTEKNTKVYKTKKKEKRRNKKRKQKKYKNKENTDAKMNK